MNAKDQTEKQDISQLWNGFSGNEEIEGRNATIQPVSSNDRGEEIPLPDVVLYEPFSSFSLLPPFTGTSVMRIFHESIENFVSFLSRADRVTRNINMLLTGGDIPAYGTLDAQVSYKIPKIKSLIKLGASNLLNQYYSSAFGNPQIGGLYYLSFGFNVFK